MWDSDGLGASQSRLTLLYAHSYRLKVIFQHFHDERLIARATPAIALDAADEPFPVVVDLDERSFASRARLEHHPLANLTTRQGFER
jgi:hypothetical protein